VGKDHRVDEAPFGGEPLGDQGRNSSEYICPEENDTERCGIDTKPKVEPIFSAAV
jgi:hypothetical protein